MLEMPSKAEFIESSEKRVSNTELAKIYFISKTTIDRWIRFYGLNRKRTGFKKEILERFIKTDMTKKAIAEELKCNINTLNTYLNKYGINREVK